jgi:signal peptidase II
MTATHDARADPGARTQDSGHSSRAAHSGRAWAVMLVVAAAALAGDLFSKWLAFRTIAGSPVVVRRERVLEVWERSGNLSNLIPNHEPVHVVPRLLDLSLVLNPGAVFGMGAGKRWFFVAFTVGAMALAFWMFASWTRARDTVAHVAIGLLIAGGLGNLYDRIAYACVRDFLHPLPGVMLPGTQRELWPYVSNIADLWLLVGIGILMVYLWRQGGKKEGTKGRGHEGTEARAPSV